MATEVEQLVKRVDALKADKAKAQGVVENIQARWRDELGTDDPEKVKKIIAETESQVKELSDSYEQTIQEAQRLLDEAEKSR